MNFTDPNDLTHPFNPLNPINPNAVYYSEGTTSSRPSSGPSKPCDETAAMCAFFILLGLTVLFIVLFVRLRYTH